MFISSSEQLAWLQALSFSEGKLILLYCVSMLSGLETRSLRLNILSVNEKLPVYKFCYFGKYIIQLGGYFSVHAYGQRHTGLETKTSSTSPGIIVHVIHLHFDVFPVFENFKASFS